MNLNYLLNQVYFSKEDLPEFTWKNLNHSPQTINSPLTKSLIYIYETYKLSPFLYEEKIINNTDQLLKLIDTNLEQIESDMLLMIYFVFNVRKGNAISEKKFNALTFPERCEYLCIPDYPKNRNLHFLLSHYTCINNHN